jgi:hypothetical protein
MSNTSKSRCNDIQVGDIVYHFTDKDKVIPHIVLKIHKDFYLDIMCFDIYDLVHQQHCWARKIISYNKVSTNDDE